MPQGLLIKLRPTGPWRIGPDSGVRDRVGRVYHSDALFAAVSQAMAQLGRLDEWLDATARAGEPMCRLRARCGHPRSLREFAGRALGLCR
jgi:hypothetical protein